MTKQEKTDLIRGLNQLYGYINQFYAKMDMSTGNEVLVRKTTINLTEAEISSANESILSTIVAIGMVAPEVEEVDQVITPLNSNQDENL